MKRTACILVGSIVLAWPTVTLCADDPTTSCLTAEQQDELFKRLMLEIAMPVVQAKIAHTSAAAAHTSAKKALESCEAARDPKSETDPCGSERESMKRAHTAVEAAKANTVQAGKNLANQERIKEIRAEYPDCGSK